MSAAASLRAQIADKKLIVAPGSYDCITARMIERAGFGAVYVSGGCSAIMLGFPDYGLVSATEMIDNAGRIAGSVGVPVIADADTGYGNELNVTRTVRDFEQKGVAAIHIEDQTFPKVCGHLDGKEVLPLDRFTNKIRAAAAARRNRDTIIIARTDSRATHGFEEAVRRMNAALEAGADVAFLEAPQTMEETAMAPKLIKGPCLLNVVRGGKSPLLDLRQAEEMGYSIAILPVVLLMNAIGLFEKLLKEVRNTRVHPQTPITVREMFQCMGSGPWDEIQGKYKIAS
jgi:2-methylisocitrate lyase-like PEP mutase family enzyme